MALIAYSQPTAAPTAKVQAVGLAGLLITAVVALLASFGVIVPDGLSEQASQAVGQTIFVISTLQAIAQFAAGYFKKSVRKV